MKRKDIDQRAENYSDMFAVLEAARAETRKRAHVEISPNSDAFKDVVDHYNNWYDNNRYQSIIDIVGNHSDFMNMVIDAALEISATALGAKMHSGAMARLFVEIAHIEATSGIYDNLSMCVTSFLHRFV